MTEFKLPSLGADMESAIFLEWKIKPGDPVKRGDIVAVVETDKGAIDVEIFNAGIVDKLIAQKGERVAVGAPIAVLRDGDEKGPAAQPLVKPTVQPSATQGARVPPSVSPQASAAQIPPEAPAPAQPAAAGPRAVPAAKKLARERGIDLSAVRGTGEGGAITKADVEAAGAAGAKPVDRQAAMRRAIATAMVRSKREIPHYYLSESVDMTTILGGLAARNSQKPLPERILNGVLLLKAVALTAREFPDMNGFWKDDKYQPAERINLGVAITLRDGGLVTPALHDADQKSVAELMANLSDVITRARAGAGSLRSSEVTDATLTVTNLGDLGVETVFGVIYPPQVALVGCGKIADRPWVVNGKLEVRKIASVTLAADHRASDGMRGAQFLTAVKRRLEASPGELL